jgi:hypothetical protein
VGAAGNISRGIFKNTPESYRNYKNTPQSLKITEIPLKFKNSKIL